MSAGRSFAVKVASVATGTATGAAVAGASSLLLARLYTPEHFGVLGLAMAATSMAVAAAAGKFDVAIPLESDPVPARGLAWAAALSSACAAVLAACVLAVAQEQLDRSRHVGVLALALIPPIVLCAGLAQAGYGIALREERYGDIGLGRALGPATAAVIQVAFGFFWLSGTSLVIGQLIGLVCVGWLLWSRAADARPWPGRRSVIDAARRHWRMPAFVASSNLLTMAGLHAPLVLLGTYFSLAIAGVYAVTYRVLTAPALLLGQAIGQVFYARVARETDLDVRRRVVERTAGLLFDVSAITFAWVYVLAPAAFTFAFGERWEATGDLARLLVPWLAASFVSSPINQFALVCGRQSAVLKISLAETAARALSLSVGVAMESAKVLVLLFSLSGAAIATIYACWILTLADCRWSSWLRQRALAALVGTGVLGLALLEVVAVPPSARVALLAGTALISIGIVWRRVHSLRLGDKASAGAPDSE